jgi:ABC-type nitrate/sulfonate/bicarbonate transport system permease component
MQDRAGPAVIERVILPTARDIDPHAHAVRERRLYFLLAWLAPVVIILLWAAGVHSDLIDARFFPSPETVASEAIDLVSTGELWKHVWATTRRVALGFPIGAVTGIMFGLFLGRFAWARAAFQPTVTAAYTIPKLGLYPLLLLIFGIDDMPKVVLVAISTFLLVCISAAGAVANIPQNLLDVGRAFHASRRMQFFEIILPSALPEIFTSLRIAIGMAILVVIGTEFVNARDGIGFLIWNSWTLFQPEPMYVGMVVSGIMGVLATGAVGLFEDVAMPWRSKRRGKRNKPVQRT